MKIKISYKGELDRELDKELEELLIGWELGGSGYNFKEEERDLEFTKEPTSEEDVRVEM